MSLSVCIPDLIEQGKLTGQRATRAAKLYDELVAQYEGKFGRDAAESMATVRTIDVLDGEFSQANRVAALGAKAQGRWHAEMRRRAGSGPFSPTTARDMLERLDGQIEAVRNGYLTGFGEFLARHRRNALGILRFRGELDLIGRERFGEATGDVNAREMAEAMGATMEAMRLRRNAAGGDTAKLDGWALPQAHDSRLVRQVPYETWRDFGPMARARIRDIETGEWATGLRREAILRDSYESIRSDGADSASPGAMGKGALANQRGDARVIHFENYDDWIAYQQRFGSGDNVYDIFVGHVSAMSREIALMERLGPNPNAMLKFQQDWLRKSIMAQGSEKQIGKLPKYEGELQRTLDQLTGAATQPTDRGVALGFSALRAWQVATKLGGAVLATAPDFVLMMKTARFNNLSIVRTLGEYVRQWSPADFARGGATSRENARLNAKLQIITDDFLALSAASYRFTGQEFSNELTRRLGDGVIRLSGLARHTRIGQYASGRQFHANLTEWRGRSLTELDPKVQQQFARYEISSGDWDIYRAAPVAVERGQEWLFPGNVADVAVREKFVAMVLGERDMAVIVPHIRTRKIAAAVGQPGSWGGEIFRSALLFKSFPLDIIVRHGGFTFERAGMSGSGRSAYAIALLPAMIVAGALSVQLKNMAAMKDPEPMESDEFWLKAVAQSGAMGVFGDVVFNQSRQYEMGLLQWAAGPLIGDAIGIGTDVRENARKALDRDEDTESRWMMDGIDNLARQVPGNNVWYTRQAYERLFIDQLRMWADEDAAAQKFARRKGYAEDQGTGFWWPPGEGFEGMRAPDLSNAMAGGEEEGAAPAGW